MKFAKIFDTADGGQVLFFLGSDERGQMTLTQMTQYEGMDVGLSFTYGDPEDRVAAAQRRTYFDGLGPLDAEAVRRAATRLVVGEEPSSNEVSLEVGD